MVKLSERLSIVFNMIDECQCLADVGCDHGYLSIAAVQSGKAKTALAMDINQGPLDKALEHITEYGLTSSITTRLSDGLNKINVGEADAIAICGMGGKLMARIITDGFDVAKEASFLIVEPQSDLAEFRQAISDLGFEILDEELISEQNKFYPIMKISFKGVGKVSPLSEAELIYGPFILKKKPVLLSALINKDKELYLSLLSSLEIQKANKPSSSVDDRIKEVCHMLEVINEITI